MMKIFMRQTEAISPGWFGSTPSPKHAMFWGVVYVPTIRSTFGFHLRRHHCLFLDTRLYVLANVQPAVAVEKPQIHAEIPLAESIEGT